MPFKTLNSGQTSLIYNHYSNFRMNRTGFPAQTSLPGISLFIIEPAPIIAFSPIVTDLHIIELHPMSAFFFDVYFTARICFYGRVHKMCHDNTPCCNTHSRFYGYIFRIVSIENHIFTDKCLFRINNIYPPP